VGVGVHRDRDIRVPEPLLHDFGVHAGAEGKRCPGVPQVVHPDPRHVDAGDGDVEQLSHAVGVPRRAIFACEDVPCRSPRPTPSRREASSVVCGSVSARVVVSFLSQDSCTQP